MNKTLGIDLGTTNSAAAIIGPDGRPHMIAYDDERIVPSVVSLNHDGQLLVGRSARNYAAVDPHNTVRSVKRAMGSDEQFQLGEKAYAPQEIAALVLTKIKELAEAHLGETVERAVITVPAYFSDAERRATQEAGRLAGLDVVRIVNEPTAAALAYSAGRDLDETILVYDLGGGTFDVSIVRVEAGIVEVLATAGNNRLGGDDFDRRVVDHVVEYFTREHSVDLREDRRAMARLLLAAEEAKKALSQVPFVTLREEFLAEKDGTPVHLDFELERSRFEHLIDDLVGLTLDLVDHALQDAGLDVDDLDQVVLVGGSTRIPYIHQSLAHYLDIEPTGRIHPDECVAMGAAVQAAIVDGDAVDTILVDVTAHSLGVEAAQSTSYGLMPGMYHAIIPRNTVVPTSRGEVFTTVTDGQESVEVRVFQGEAEMVEDNQFLDEFSLTGLPKRARAGEPQIVVTFTYDSDGIVHVRAEDRKSKRGGEIKIEANRLLMDDEQLAQAGSAVRNLWQQRASIEADAMPSSTRRLLAQAQKIASDAPEAKRERILAMVADIESHCRRVQLTEAEEDELGDLEAELIDALAE